MTSISSDGVTAVMEAGALAASPKERLPGDSGAIHAIVPEGWTIAERKYDLTGMQAQPSTRRGEVEFLSVESLADYVVRHADDDSAVFVSARGESDDRITAVLDYHGPTNDDARWGDHRAVMRLTASEEWIRWSAANERKMSQVDFAEMIEGGTAQILDPDAAAMLSIVQTLSGSKAVRWESGVRTNDGNVRLQWVEESTAAAQNNEKRQVDIPAEFTLLLRPWAGSDIAIRIRCMFRYRIGPTGILMWFVMRDVEPALAEARDALVGDLTIMVEPKPAAGGQPARGGTEHVYQGFAPRIRS